MTDIIKTIKGVLKPKVFVENIWLFAVLGVFLAMYGPHLPFQLPNGVKNVFNNYMFRSVIIFLIVYMANKDFTAALVITVIFVITLNILHTSNVLDNVRDVLSREKFQINGAPVANCGTYNNANHSETGSVYYPLHDNDSVKHLRDGNHLGAELNAELNLD
tara:strand:- start:1864 stop:2346 length:483 start_codon:yes stop_codon:yes gene_type:complete